MSCCRSSTDQTGNELRSSGFNLPLAACCSPLCGHTAILGLLPTRPTPQAGRAYSGSTSSRLPTDRLSEEERPRLRRRDGKPPLPWLHPRMGRQEMRRQGHAQEPRIPQESWRELCNHRLHLSIIPPARTAITTLPLIAPCLLVMLVSYQSCDYSTLITG